MGASQDKTCMVKAELLKVQFPRSLCPTLTNDSRNVSFICCLVSFADKANQSYERTSIRRT